jgi:hypothetical protein
VLRYRLSIVSATNSLFLGRRRFNGFIQLFCSLVIT